MKSSPAKTKKRVLPLKPSFAEEITLHLEGYKLIAGIDEAGRGALAGPVVAAAAVMPYPLKGPWKKLIRDSKQLTPKARESLFDDIHRAAITTGVGIVDLDVIDKQGIARATELAMKLAVENLSPSPQFLLIDYFRLPEVMLPQKGVVDGDSLCFSIACASIVAKVARDRLMVELDKAYPGYGLARHKGYGTEEHLECLFRLGPSAIHRQSFQPVRDASRKI